ncbi:MAG TPA: hypothetical protein VNL92_00625 [Dehalococcoidia bacterium]|nr:hypothetical protein [Dehalococcoidia bacterium]
MIDRLPGYEFTTGEARRSVVRSAIIFTPLLLLTLAVLIAMIVNRATGGDASLVLIVIVGLIALLVGFQSIEALRDLRAELKETRGRVRRSWSRSDFFFWRSYYIHVDETVFKVRPETHVVLKEGDEVVITHMPHTATIETIAKVRPEPSPPETGPSPATDDDDEPPAHRSESSDPQAPTVRQND